MYLRVVFATVLLRGCIACLGFAIFFLHLFAKALFSFFSIHTHCHLFQFFMFKINRNRLDTRTSAGVSEGSKLSGTKILGLGGPATRQIYLWEIHVRHVHYIDENICTLLSHQYTVYIILSHMYRDNISMYYPVEKNPVSICIPVLRRCFCVVPFCGILGCMP